jgi:Tol biopolymer transport system component
LAKLKPQRNEPVDSQVATQKKITDPGVVMGTVGYMSPEQVRGQEADHRADIFSFGIILFEMLSGQRPFQGESFAETMAAIVKEEAPELGATNAKISPALDKIVRRCLEKRPERRFQSASDLGFALEALSTPSRESGSGVNPKEAGWKSAYPAWRERLAWIVAGVLGLALLAVSVAYFRRPAAETRALHLSFEPPEKVSLSSYLPAYVEVSPDGRLVAFTGSGADGQTQLWLRPLDSTEAKPLPGTEQAMFPFWSPDSRSLGFFAQGKLKRIDLAGGRPQLLADVTNPRGGSWNGAGVILFSPSIRQLFQIPATGAAAKLVVKGIDDGADLPYFLPDGRHFLCRGGREGISVGSLDSKELKPLLPEGVSPRYAPPGWLLYEREGALLAQPFDTDRLILTGDPVPIARQVMNAANIRAVYSVSNNGVLVWRGSGDNERRLSWFDRNGKRGNDVGATTSNTSRLSLSPNGERVAVTRFDPQTRIPDIWVIEIARNIPTRLTSNPEWDQNAVWSPEGNRIIFYASKEGSGGIYQKAASGVGDEEFLLKVWSGVPNDWSRDGKYVIYSQSGEKTQLDLLVLPTFGDRQPFRFLTTEFAEGQGQFSPDGRWVAYVSTESGNQEVYVQPFSVTGSNDGKGSGGKLRISPNGGNQPRWRRDGKELFYVAGDNTLMAVPVNTAGATFEAGATKPLFKTRLPWSAPGLGIEYDVTADGQRFLMNAQVGEAKETPVSVILNWTAGLKQ